MSDTPNDFLSDQAEEGRLQALGQRFFLALEALRALRTDDAAELLRGVLREEPRLPEPHMELSRILLEAGQLDEALEHAEEAVRLLDAGGQWIDDLAENEVQSLAWNLKAEVLRLQADSDEVVFGDPAVWADLMKQSKEAFAKAADLDPNNRHADHWGHHLGDGEEEAEGGADDGELDALLGVGERRLPVGEA